MKKTYKGSCHCGTVRFECAVDLAPADRRSPPELPGVWWTSTFRCNCSMCWKARMWKVFARPSDFRLLTGQDALTEHQFGSRVIAHKFCSRCGVRPFASAFMEQMGGAFYAINVACLDDATPQELAEAPITYEDGRHDAWDKAPEETRYL